MNAVSHRKLRRAAQLLTNALDALAHAIRAEHHDGDRRTIERIRHQAQTAMNKAMELHQRHE
jgi:Flp pilus assembly protein TadG